MACDTALRNDGTSHGAPRIPVDATPDPEAQGSHVRHTRPLDVARETAAATLSAERAAAEDRIAAAERREAMRDELLVVSLSSTRAAREYRPSLGDQVERMLVGANATGAGRYVAARASEVFAAELALVRGVLAASDGGRSLPGGATMADVLLVLDNLRGRALAASSLDWDMNAAADAADMADDAGGTS